MPGKRYRYRILKGPFANRDCRLVAQPDAWPDHARVIVRGQKQPWLMPLDWIERKNGRKPHGVPRRH
jgi:hypothetical protein